MPKERPAYPVRSLEKSIRILNELCDADEPLGITALSERLDLPASGVHRHLDTLHYHGFVEQDSVTDKYRLGLRLVELGASVLRDLDLVDRARPYLERLASETGETVNLSVLQGAEALFVDKISSQRFLRTVTHVGARFPLHCTGVGKAMMAHLRDDKLEALLASEPLDRHTPATIVDPEKLKVHLNLVRTRGYAIDDEEFIAGVRCVAAPILGPDGYALGAISVAAPSARLSLKRAQDVGAAVREIAQILSGMARLEETGLGKRRR